MANEEDKNELDLATESSTIKWMLKADLLELHKREERDLIQKRKLNWMKLGDENTKFFHRFLSAKKRRNLISELVNDQVVNSTHGSHPFLWHTSGKENLRLRSPWISISREWRKIEVLTNFRIGNRSSVFWTDPWLDNISLNSKFPRLSHIALLPKGSISEHWDSQTSSWVVYFRRLIIQEEVVDFQTLMISLNGKMVNSIPYKKVWSRTKWLFRC